jgi:hypothetical protein
LGKLKHAIQADSVDMCSKWGIIAHFRESRVYGEIEHLEFAPAGRPFERFTAWAWSLGDAHTRANAWRKTLSS